MYFLFKFIPINLKRKCISLVRITQTYVDVSTLLRSNLTYYSSVLQVIMDMFNSLHIAH